jgi:Prokaryotic homologs of the JAB domain
MLKILLTPDVHERFVDALRRAGSREIGGVLMAEHTGVNEFTVREISVQRRGTLASFVRHVAEAIVGLRRFFERTQRSYTRFNYLGEWHSHPLFSTQPSGQDDASMRAIVEDVSVGATFAVLLVLKLSAAQSLMGSAHTYLPDGSKHEAILALD